MKSVKFLLIIALLCVLSTNIYTTKFRSIKAKTKGFLQNIHDIFMGAYTRLSGSTTDIASFYDLLKQASQQLFFCIPDEWIPADLATTLKIPTITPPTTTVETKEVTDKEKDETNTSLIKRVLDFKIEFLGLTLNTDFIVSYTCNTFKQNIINYLNPTPVKSRRYMRRIFLPQNHKLKVFLQLFSEKKSKAGVIPIPAQPTPTLQDKEYYINTIASVGFKFLADSLKDYLINYLVNKFPIFKRIYNTFKCLQDFIKNIKTITGQLKTAFDLVSRFVITIPKLIKSGIKSVIQLIIEGICNFGVFKKMVIDFIDFYNDKNETRWKKFGYFLGGFIKVLGTDYNTGYTPFKAPEPKSPPSSDLSRVDTPDEIAFIIEQKRAELSNMAQILYEDVIKAQSTQLEKQYQECFFCIQSNKEYHRQKFYQSLIDENVELKRRDDEIKVLQSEYEKATANPLLYKKEVELNKFIEDNILKLDPTKQEELKKYQARNEKLSFFYRYYDDDIKQMFYCLKFPDYKKLKTEVCNLTKYTAYERCKNGQSSSSDCETETITPEMQKASCIARIVNYPPEDLDNPKKLPKLPGEK